MDKDTERLLKNQLLRSETDRAEADIQKLETKRAAWRAERGLPPKSEKSGKPWPWLVAILVVIAVVLVLVL